MSQKRGLFFASAMFLLAGVLQLVVNGSNTGIAAILTGIALLVVAAKRAS